MPYCSNCGKLVSDTDKFCQGCGAPLNRNFTPNNNSNNPKSIDKNNPGYNILSFLYPIVGLILYIVWKDDYPIRAKGCGKWALISVITYVLLVICYVLFILFLAFSPYLL